MFSSADGYCSAAVFSDGELGSKYEKLPDYNAEYDIEMMDIPDTTATPNTNMPQKRRVSASISTSTTSTLNQQIVTPSSSLLTPEKVEKTKKRRITPILISTPLEPPPPPPPSSSAANN